MKRVCIISFLFAGQLLAQNNDLAIQKIKTIITEVNKIDTVALNEHLKLKYVNGVSCDNSSFFKIISSWREVGEKNKIFEDSFFSEIEFYNFKKIGSTGKIYLAISESNFIIFKFDRKNRVTEIDFG